MIDFKTEVLKDKGVLDAIVGLHAAEAQRKSVRLTESPLSLKGYRKHIRNYYPDDRM